MKNVAQETMSSRKLGGGRILGGGRSLSANIATFPQRNSSFLSPTASSVSVSSSRSTSQDPQDLSSRVSLEQSDDKNVAAIAAATTLVCPICNEETVSSV